jgi:hypothetical protein
VPVITGEFVSKRRWQARQAMMMMARISMIGSRSRVAVMTWISWISYQSHPGTTPPS